MGIGPGRGIDDGEDDEEDVAVGIGEGSETVVLFLTCSIPESEVDHASVYLDGGGIVVEDSWYILCWKLVLSIAE